MACVSPQPPLILLVGMHRSGTSLLGSLLPELGVPLPGELIAGDVHNPEGYHEWTAVTELQEQLLMALGRWWPGPYGPEPLPESWLNHPATRQVHHELQRLLSVQCKHQHGPWAIKDPRTSLLLPLWRKLAAELELPLRLVLALRDPAEVLVSLVNRDRSSTGMDPVRAQRLWWRHNRQTLADGRNLPLMVIDYGRWFHNPKAQLQALAHFCGTDPEPDALERACGCIQPQHRRSLQQGSIATVHPRLRRLHRHLQRHPHNPKLRALPYEPLISRRQQLRCWLHASEMDRIQRSGWFDPVHYRQQLSNLPATADPLLHYLRLGWRQKLSPHPQLGPTSPRTLTQYPAGHSPWLEDAHPLGCAALALRHGHASQATELLHHWLHNRHIAAGDLETIARVPTLLVAKAISGDPESTLALAISIQADLDGSNPAAMAGDPHEGTGHTTASWALHAWLQRCPIDPEKLTIVPKQDPATIFPDPEAARIGVHCEPLDSAGLSLDKLERYQQLTALFDPCSAQVELWRRLGVPALFMAAGTGVTNGWLARPDDADAAATRLGLPQPIALVERSQPTGTAPILCFGHAKDPGWHAALDARLWHLPGFDQLHLEHPDDPRLLASWLELAAQAGVQLVRLNPTSEERRLEPWRALSPITSGGSHSYFQDPISPAELLEELDWQAQGSPLPVPIQTPTPGVHIRWQGGHTDHGHRPAASLCISLYNYAHTIEIALKSAAAQTLKDLELIVVNDSSSDGGEQIAEQWCRHHGHRFSRCLLLDHDQNSGLAAARNTAFQTAQAEWCFVMDADNRLDPTAMEDCLSIAKHSQPNIAVVHPLIRREVPHPSGVTTELFESRNWQTAIFRHGNAIDAMAMIRRSAWLEIGGYRHIPGGWEDFDFWCQLIAKSFSGLICPRPLATYVDHGDSMRSQNTDRRQRALSRLLQGEHAWLQLPLNQTREVSIFANPCSKPT